MIIDQESVVPTRQSLLLRLKDWTDDRAWREFFDIYWRLIYTTATRSGLRDAEAQDVVQETLAAVNRAMPNFKYDPEVGSFKAWLRRVTSRKVLDHLDRVRRKDVTPAASRRGEDREKTATVERIPDPSSEDWTAAWEEDWRRNLFEAAVERVKRRVTPKTFQLFELRVLQERPVSEITRTFKVSIGEVYLAKHRVGKLIKEEVRRLSHEVV